MRAGRLPLCLSGAVLTFLAAMAAAVAAQTPFPLTVDAIMQGPDAVGHPPSGLRWSGDSRQLFFEWQRPGEEEASTWVVDRDGAEPRRLSEEERKLAPPATGGRWDQARRRVLFVDRGDVVLVDTVARRRHQITRTTATEANPRWARQDSHVTFTRDGNLFIAPVAPGAEEGPAELLRQLTDVGPAKAEPKLTDAQKHLQEEEKGLLEYVRRQAEKEAKEDARRKAQAPPKVELREGQRALDLALSPDDRHVFLLVADRAQGAKTVDVPKYITESAYPETVATRTVVGDVQEKRSLAVLDLESGHVVWAGSPAPELDVRWTMPGVSRDGRHVVVSVRAMDNKARWIVRLDPTNGETRILHTATDDAWVREGGGFNPPPVPFLEDDRRVWFLSERDGWMHLYTLDVSAADPRAVQITSGRFEIDNVQLAVDGRTFYIRSTEAHPGERHVYSVPVGGGSRTRITIAPGAHAASPSPDGTVLGLVSSFMTRPPEVFLMVNEPGAPPRQVTTTPVEAWRSFNWIEPELITFKARDGAAVHARLYRPERIGATPDAARPGVVFVHGAGYLQNAHRYWSTYYREYMFHHLLASRGYVVLDVDYRGSAGYGRDWRTGIYRHMGGKDLDDIVDGAKYLIDAHRVHPERVGVYGGSYGGFITLMAMFTTPDVFAAGAALRPVTDWAHYSHGYTSNILNVPQEDAEAYRRSSPIYFAEGLKGALLICHGMVDVNVHFQDAVRLAQRLIELRKENWELAVYPVEDHAFSEATSWADQYRRILRLFERELRRSVQ
jgi:dipeptidyl aminopeptidase/acylaminoacyl peptidase